MVSASVLMPPSTSVSGILFYVRTQYSRRTRAELNNSGLPDNNKQLIHICTLNPVTDVYIYCFISQVYTYLLNVLAEFYRQSTQ